MPLFNLTAEEFDMEFTDLRFGGSYTLTCRRPTDPERERYVNSLFERKGKGGRVPKQFTFREQARAGAELIQRLPEDTFGDGDKPISSDPASPNYRENWRALLLKGNPEACLKIQETMYRPVTVKEDEPALDDAGDEADAGDTGEAEVDAEAPLASKSAVS